MKISFRSTLKIQRIVNKNKLNEILKNNSYPEIYHRCCKVMQKLTGMLIGKSFFWEVDRTIYLNKKNRWAVDRTT